MTDLIRDFQKYCYLCVGSYEGRPEKTPSLDERNGVWVICLAKAISSILR